MRLLTHPVANEDTIRKVAANTHAGQFVCVNDNGEWAIPNSAGTAQVAKYVLVKEPEFSSDADGFDNHVESGYMARGVNGCRVQFDTDNLNIAAAFSAVAPGTKLALTTGGLVTVSGTSSVAGTEGFLSFVSFVGNTTSGILVANVDYMI